MSIGVLSLAFVVAAVGSVPADVTREDRSEARRLKNDAFTRIAEGDYARGVELLEAAYAAVPHPTFLFNIAVVYDQWSGHCSESLTAFDRFFEACADCRVRATAEKRFALVKERCEVKLSITSIPTGSRVTVDDEHEGKTPFETKLRPGRHRVRVAQDGFEPHAEDVLLEPGRDQSLSVPLVPTAAAPPAELELTSAAPPPEAGRLRTWGWVALGAGAVGAGVGAAFTALAFDAKDRADDLARVPDPDAGEVNAARDEAQAQSAVMVVGYGVGAVGLGTGILLQVLAGREAPSERRVSVGTDGRGIVLSGRF